jgi:hypothetical protein
VTLRVTIQEVPVPTHLSRKELKQDNVALKVEETTHFLITHRPLVMRVAIIVLAVLVVGLGSWFFISSRRDAREQALAAAVTMQNAPVGAAPPNGGVSFPSEIAKTDAVHKAFSSIISQDAGSNEAYAAEYFLAGIDVSNAKTDDALKKYTEIASGADSDYASLAKLAKAQLLFSLGNGSEAKTILDDLIAHPTATVSKEQATFTLAKGIAATQPEEARKLLVPIANLHNEISQAAVNAMTELPAAKQ